MPTNAMRTLPAPGTDFIGLRGTVNLASGGEPPMLVSHRMSFEEFACDKAAGYRGYHRHWQVAQGVRAQLARLLQLNGNNIALLGNCSEAIARVTASIRWQAGDNVVVSELDYASGRYALASLRRSGVEIRLAAAQQWQISTDSLLNLCDHRTRLVYASQITSLTGQHLEIAALSSALLNTNTLLLVDASHALGVVPVRADLADFTVSSCYKFALGIHDGVLAWNRQRCPQFEPHSAGWWSADSDGRADSFTHKPDARRAEYGNVNHLGTYILRESLDYLEQFGIDAIAAHVRNLGGQLIAGMQALGLQVITPTPPNQRGASAAFVYDDMQIIERAAQAGILIWGDSGRVRVSAHLFTSDTDIATFLDQLPDLLKPSEQYS